MKNIILHTNGSGLWSNKKTKIRVIDIRIVVFTENNQPICGDLQVKFDHNDWNVDQDGYIYTDEQFQQELNQWLCAQGFTSKVEYSEQGLQSDEYVSFDVDVNFCKKFLKMYPNHVKMVEIQ